MVVVQCPECGAIHNVYMDTDAEGRTCFYCANCEYQFTLATAELAGDLLE